MNKKNRDLLLLVKNNAFDAAALDKEVDQLHQLLFAIERLDHFVKAHELIDMRRYKIYNSSFRIKNAIREKKEQAFVFLFNKN
jgi:hypothetical protein